MNSPVSAGRQCRLLLLMCAGVCACSWVSLRLFADGGSVYCIWLANAVISGFVLTAPPRWKPAFFLAGQSAGMAVDLALGDVFWASAGCTLSNCVEVLLTVLPLRHFASRADIISRKSLCRIAYFGAFVGPLGGALLGAPVISVQYHQPYLEALRFWFLSESLGAASGLSVMLFLLTREKRKPGTPRTPAFAIITRSIPLLVVAVFVFWQTRYPIVFLIFPPLLLVMFRFRLAGAIFGTSLVVILGAAFTVEGHGPFKLYSGDSPAEQVTLFHIFGLTLVSTCISVGYTIEERVRLESALEHANQRLKDLALMDALTGVRNRRGFDEAMEREWTVARANRAHISLLYLDIDYFKRFNDTYGHQLGDDCLRSVAGALLGSVRTAADVVSRYGGEEFVIALPGASAESARMTAERIAAAIRGLNIPHRASPFAAITISVGVATETPQSGGTPTDLLHAADEALYEAKERGRNRIESRAQGNRSSANAYAPTAIASLVPSRETPTPVRASAS